MVKIFRFLFVCAVLLAIAGCGFVGITLWYFGRDLPDYQQLAHYQPPIMTRVQAGDGRLLAEYATERRIFVPIQAIPKPVINAFLSAEDKNFYNHHGVDPVSILRAAITDVSRFRANRRPVGAAEQKITNHEPGHVDQGGRRRFERSEPLERRIPFAPEPQDLAVEMLFAGKMPEQQRFGNPGRLGQLPSGRAGKPLPGKERHCRRDDCFAPLVAIQSDRSHWGALVSAYLLGVKPFLIRERRRVCSPPAQHNLKSGDFRADTA
jgi:hypothetical protein